ncbi:MAG: tRNA (adenosine(37)-N6)-dimethylallyltransferase MiaA [Tenericutes bacterium GWC2_34_14]|nr:MAG: tRNA (adenosine(37)-N6)-dimethylallyltransferase MiaA [Tenericutes bacterium GWA2_35_7]OHE28504.1 MAG: tRNA (adenosine(37)-N6)-dimethylallyltransferase MiaA [Tenericutes bacterium GWC2_34_14]OHE33588.1 MAG: tRNA (adenosine(37)-N6)-dimethylallyltransferase MiaA [Tenericutes bacterium GWE2_34_108]OHE36873.1 MAG: tRNA (adenosine(37)-N6)-dimethylallyltransferase MiaA [Tenericutes bacterium GWF1_35_14]OHE38047.1 MAG: tRNA (adenosine(37)-N6)-dimethylallyltransferase MiaA [Tenericutes bacteriu
MKKLIILVGPTGSGKTHVSIELAKTFGCEIINGDSVQVYKRLDIGSAKIKESDMMGVKHHLLDMKDPKDNYSVFEFQKDVRKLIEEIKLPMIVGGTGFYINAAISKFEFVEEKRDASFDLDHETYSNLELYQKLIKLDPDIIIDGNNRRRVLRALEQAMAGTPRSTKNKKDERLFDPLIIYLDLDKDILTKRLNLRLEKQLEEGFIEEVKALKEEGIIINAIGYREINRYLDGLLTYDEMKEEIIKVSRKLAKKQKTYFINQMKPLVYNALSDTLIDDLKKAIKAYVEEDDERNSNT